MRSIIIIALIIIICQSLSAQQQHIKAAVPMPTGKIFTDTDGKPINAHGAGIIEYNGMYYMFGETKKGTTWLVAGQAWEDYRVPAGGVSCYSSKDLITWRNEGVALKPVTGDPGSDLDTGKVMERPKVVYNKKTHQFVRWMHVDKNDYSY